ncbi:MAG TPA: non-heme iron oxygenase ferredoxin subunit [Dehalococcoidia bacterium]|nr:non-heme iron oxygenase ferredoxin subunit [Dehalococcoidia bacterium]
MTFERVASIADVPAGAVKVVAAGGRSIALCNLDGSFYAVDNLCTHDNGPLGEGTLYDGTVECPRHGARFDVQTGAVKALPAVRPVKTYAVQVDGDEVSVDVG